MEEPNCEEAEVVQRPTQKKRGLDAAILYLFLHFEKSWLMREALQLSSCLEKEKEKSVALCACAPLLDVLLPA